MLAVALSAILYALLISNSLAELGRGSLRQRQSPKCAASSFTNVVNLPGVTVTIEKAVSISERGSYAESGNQGFPQTIDLLPALCAVTVRVTNTSDVPIKPQSSYRIGLFLPTTTNWNSTILTVGSASFAGGINWPGMSEGTHYGFATISTDNGHNSAGSDLSWATPARLYDWGYRALHGSVLVGKLLVAHYYSNSPTYSYYAGCSTGGRQGLREIQYDTNSFDGALIGAPAWDTMHLMPWISKIAAQQLNTTANGRLRATQLSILATEVLRQCDAQDGVKDNIISQPDQCRFDISKIICSDPSRCLTRAQADTAGKIYGEYIINSGNGRNRTVYNGFTLSSEDQWSVYFGSDAALSDFDFSYERYWLYNLTSTQPPYTWQQYSDQVVLDSERINAGQATANQFDALSSYRNRGGKIIMYHGLADGLISPKTSLAYYNATISSMNTSEAREIRSWFRYFQVPGMQHCYFSNRFNAPWDFGAPGQASQLRMLPALGTNLKAFGDGWSVPGHLGDERYDMLAALVKWVEEGREVEQVVATAFKEDLSEGVYRTRPVCAWPGRAVWDGRGDVDVAGSWRCV
ncbi:Tannase/feruloyl esterase [Neurospora tetraspora]|uniref:Carboxylic ester hydrolase n=1 Tax=Neurospora tetraspora TaxID=94610 RepID=A0AAE0JQG4_9PEZI|nr:Tannase/feruloyl esterase [Neurospora tetraspora]